MECAEKPNREKAISPSQTLTIALALARLANRGKGRLLVNSRSLVVIGIVFASISGSAVAQTFSDYRSYCKALVESSNETLMVRIGNFSRAQSEANMQGLTDPKALKMIRELLDFAYSRPTTMPLPQMQDELLQLCLGKKIFVQ